jgi:predicted ATPase/DNA-binding SARP family transcriptional activator
MMIFPLPDPDPPRISVRLFGALEVVSEEGCILSFRTRKTNWLFAYLTLLRGSVAEYKVLMKTIWPDHEAGETEYAPDEAGSASAQELKGDATSVRTSLYNLYAVLHKHRFFNPRRSLIGVVLNRMTVDVYEFDDAIKAATEPALHRAVELYTGDLLPECDQAWVKIEREKRRERYVWALKKLAVDAQAIGDYQSAEPCLRRLVAADPYREEWIADLMRLLMQRGEPGLARGIYQQYLALKPPPKPTPDSEPFRLYMGLRSTPHSEPSVLLPDVPRIECAPNYPIYPIYGDSCLPALLVGRDAATVEIAGRLKQARAVLLQGPPGVGKTQLALHVCNDVRENYPDGTAFIDLTEVHNRLDALRQLTSQLRLSPAKGISDEDALIEFLVPRRLLLILDNCEHIIISITSTITKLLVKCPRLSLITTSQLAFREIPPQLVYHVGGLTVPDLEQCRRAAETPDLLLPYDAVQLYLREAANVQPGIQLTRHNATAIGELCHVLDGLPLGIKLAAADVSLRSPAETLTALQQDARSLRSRQSRLPVRQRSLWDAIDSSYKLLPVALQRTFACLGVFRGGWTVAAATQVAGSDRLPDKLLMLAERSLITSVPLPDQARFRMLDTIQRYCETQLDRLPDKSEVRHRHLDYYLRFAEQMDTALRDQQQDTALDQLEREWSNLQAALEWSVASGAAAEGLRLATALGRYWFARGGNRLGSIWLDRMLAANPGTPPELHKQALRAGGNLALQRGDYDLARACYTRILELAGGADQVSDLKVAYGNLGNCAMMQGDAVGAKRHFERFREISAEAGDERGLASSLGCLATLAHQTGDLATACYYVAESIKLLRKFGNRQRLITVLNNLADTQFELKRFADTAATLQESFALSREIDFRPGLMHCLFLHARLAQQVGMLETAARFMGSAALLRETNGLALHPDAATEQHECCEIIRARIGTAALNAATEVGRSISLSDQIALAGEVYDRIAVLHWSDLLLQP